jgi:hypothetical protein
MEDEDFPERVTWVVAYLKEKMNLDFGWHQATRKLLCDDQGSGKN